MNIKSIFNIVVAVCMVLLAGCTAPIAKEYGKWAEALDASAWESSQWISDRKSVV